MSKSWNLESFDNLYASLAQSAYNGRPDSFSQDELRGSDKRRLESGKSVKFDYNVDAKDPDKGDNSVTQGGGTDLPNEGVVYLQPDEGKHTVEETKTEKAPDPYNGYQERERTYVTNTYQKSLMSNEKTGYNAYYVSDTETINQDTQHTYFAVRGSDGFGKFDLKHPEEFRHAEDWVNNDAAFALEDAIVPQAKDATKGMKAKIAELNDKAPNAQMSITGHSLGTMVSIQGAAGLTDQELNKVDKIVLFNGPDATKSLKKAGYDDAHIQALSAKTTYYVNPFDPVSMLNRDKSYEEQLGTVNVIVPMEYTSMIDGHSSHDFGAYQIGSDGQPLVASDDYHPELLTAGRDLAKLEKNSIKELKKYVSDDVIHIVTQLTPEQFKEFLEDINDLQGKDNVKKAGALSDIAAKFGLSIIDLKKVYDHLDDIKQIAKDFQKNYNQLIKDTTAESLNWDRNNIGNIQSQIQSATGAQRILLRTELLYMATQLAEADISDKVQAATKLINGAMGKLMATIPAKRLLISMLGPHLSSSEKESLMSDLTFSNLWDEGTFGSDLANLAQYQANMSKFSQGLIHCAQALEEVDAQGASDFDSLEIPYV